MSQILGLLRLATTLPSGVRTFLPSQILEAATTLPALAYSILYENTLLFNRRARFTPSPIRGGSEIPRGQESDMKARGRSS